MTDQCIFQASYYKYKKRVSTYYYTILIIVLIIKNNINIYKISVPTYVSYMFIILICITRYSFIYVLPSKYIFKCNNEACVHMLRYLNMYFILFV